MSKALGLALILGSIYAVQRSRSQSAVYTPALIQKGEGGLTIMGPQTGPRGIRNNNPGNIEKGDNWQGLAQDQSGDSRFAVFSDPVWGIRAMAVILRGYQSRHGLNTIRGIISRWAPSSENNTEAYIRQVAEGSGFGANSPLNLNDPTTLRRVITPMIRHENGQQPYSLSQIIEGIRRA